GIRDATVTGVQTCALPICHLDAGNRLNFFEHLPEIRGDALGVLKAGLWYGQKKREDVIRADAEVKARQIPKAAQRQSAAGQQGRSEERRVGKELRSQCNAI